jgi:hypothetical protein
MNYRRHKPIYKRKGAYTAKARTRNCDGWILTLPLEYCEKGKVWDSGKPCSECGDTIKLKFMGEAQGYKEGMPIIAVHCKHGDAECAVLNKAFNADGGWGQVLTKALSEIAKKELRP